jgi:hypothetical protein
VNLLAAVASDASGIAGRSPSPSRPAVAAGTPLSTPLENSQGLPLNGFVSLINVLLGTETNGQPREKDLTEENSAPRNHSTLDHLPQGDSTQGNSRPDDSARTILTRLEAGGGNRAGITQGTPSLTQEAPRVAQAGLRVASATTTPQALIRSMLGLGSSISPDHFTADDPKPVVSTRFISTRKNSPMLELAIADGAQPSLTSLAQPEAPAVPDASSAQALIRSLFGGGASMSLGVGASTSLTDSTEDAATPDNSTRGNFLDLEIASSRSAELTSASLALAGAPDSSEANGTPALIRSSLGAPGAAQDGGTDSTARPSDAKSVKKPPPPPVRAGNQKIAPSSAQPSEVAGGRTSRDSASGDFAITDLRDTRGANGADGASSGAGSESTSGSTSESDQAQIASALELAKSQMSLTLAPLAFAARLTPVDDYHFATEPSAPDPALASAVPNAGATLDPEIMGKPASQAGFSTYANGRAGSHDDSSQDAAPRVAAVASAGDSARAFENTTPPPSSRPQIEDVKIEGAKTEGPKIMSAFGAAGDALRASESRMEPTSAMESGAPGASPVQEIALRIAQPDRPALDLRVTQREGEIHVAVRTPDTGLETALRQDLGALTSSLERAGYRIETFVPRESAGIPASGALNGAQSPNLNSGDDRQKHEPGSSGRQSGDPGGHPQQKRQRDPRPQDWLNEMENQA